MKWITGRQIEAARIAVTRYMQRQGQFGFVFSRINLLQENLLMYVWVKGKGAPEGFVAPVTQVELLSKLMGIL